ncbi:MAG: hypothetical protein Q7J36_09040 [Thiobacillus sp.]|nr:hypothetical protein [Thiobacillus sp.]
MRALAALLLLCAAPAWADPAADAEYAAERVLQTEDVLNVHVSANDQGRLTVLFGRQVGDAQIATVLKKLEQEAAIRGINHSRADIDFCPVR